VDPGLDRLLTPGCKAIRGEPFTAEELLVWASSTLEAWFREPPLGPIPEYLVAHGSVFGCVAEYEEKLEELDRWKERQLIGWLKERVGSHCRAAGDRYRLVQDRAGDHEAPRFRLMRVEDPTECDKL
jgi:hypothetical protein